MMIAALVSICAAISLVSTVRMALIALEYGADIPMGMVFLTLVTIFCTIMIWKGIREMEE